MKLNKTMIRAFSGVAQGINTIEKLAASLNKSSNRVAEIINELEKEGFVVKHANYVIRGGRKIVEVANTNHAVKLKELMFEYNTIKFEDFLSDSKLLFLAALSEDWTNTKVASELSRISKYMIDRYRAVLKRRGFIVQRRSLYKINEKAWHLLKEFLIAYKNYSTSNGQVKWKYQNEILFEINDAGLVEGSVTGLAGYSDHGIKVNVIKVLCYLPKKKISKEELFIHSLFEIKDSRTLHLALTFYFKNKLNYKKAVNFAMKYSKYTMFENMAKLFRTKEEKLKLDGLPFFEREELIRIANMYGVKYV